jgi:Family of unknown function (DUF5681)
MSVGYRNPPKHSRFKKGRSGNPRGRPKPDQKQVAVGVLFRKVAYERVRIEVDGFTVMVPRWQLYLRQIYAMALSGNHSAARLLEQLRRQFPGDALPGDPITYYISESDARL